MTDPTPSFSVNVDPTNPGQFFACCGLLELADRIWPGAEGWFAEHGREFHVACGEHSLKELCDKLAACRLWNTMTDEQHARIRQISGMKTADKKKYEEESKALSKLIRESPIVLQAPFNITLDWFVDDLAGGSRFKTWAGQQSVFGISGAMKSALTNSNWQSEACLTYSVSGIGLPFNFDSDLGAQGGANDVGFSIDSLASNATTKIETPARPVLELLAFVGLQRFRPCEIKGQNRFNYTAWNRPLPITVAAVAACDAVTFAGAKRFEFKLLYRTKYLKSFLSSIPFNGVSDE